VSTQLETTELDGFAASVDRDGEIPIGVQLGWALRASIRDGRFVPGQRMPGLRELADAAGVNVNTVRAVYQRLEREGLIDSRQGSGTFVAPESSQPSAVASIAADAAREALASGADPREVAAALYVTPSQAGPPSPEGTADDVIYDEEAAAAAARRRTLRTQIATLERAIGEIEAEHPGVAPRSTATRRGPGGPTLLSAEELEQVRSELVRRLATVQAAIDALGRGGAARESKRRGKRRTNTTSDHVARARTKARPAPAGV
jgi:DNA-binding transcriptional regulator YhcF (GntR family)